MSRKERASYLARIESQNRRLREFVHTVSTRGVQADLTPTKRVGPDDYWWCAYLQGIDTFLRDRATACLKEVEEVASQPDEDALPPIPDLVAALVRVRAMASEGDAVRQYSVAKRSSAGEIVTVGGEQDSSDFAFEELEQERRASPTPDELFLVYRDTPAWQVLK